MNVDEVSPEEKGEDPRARLKEMNFPFETAKGDRTLVDTLDAFHRAMLDRWRPLPVPTSFLVDESGRVAVIYRGTVEASQLLEDVKLLKASPEVLARAAVPFEGQWLDGIPGVSPISVSSRFIDMSMVGNFANAPWRSSSPSP